MIWKIFLFFPPLVWKYKSKAVESGLSYYPKSTCISLGHSEKEYTRLAWGRSAFGWSEIYTLTADIKALPQNLSLAKMSSMMGNWLGHRWLADKSAKYLLALGSRSHYPIFALGKFVLISLEFGIADPNRDWQADWDIPQ